MVAEIEDEYRRLLYVAMTRASERLIIGGVMPANRNAPEQTPNSHPLSRERLIQDALANHPTLTREDAEEMLHAFGAL